MNEQQERSAFERWASDDWTSPNAVLKDSDGIYKLMSVQQQWRAWQARAALAANVPQTVYQLSPTDIYDFAGWLTTRKVSMQVGSSHEAGPMAEAVGEYLKTYPERFAAAPACTCPSGDGSMRWPCPEHPAPAPEAVMLVNGMTPHQFALNELCEFQQATGCDTAEEYLAEKAAPAPEADRDAFMAGYEAAQADAKVCDLPPLGWRCTRTAGHEGPCAAVEAPEDAELVAKGMERLREAPAQAQQSSDADLAMMLRRCASALQSAGRAGLQEQVLDLLHRKGLQGSPLREAKPEAQQSAERWSSFDDWWLGCGIIGSVEAECKEAFAAGAATKAKPEAQQPLTDEQIMARKPASADFVSFRAGVRCVEIERVSGGVATQRGTGGEASRSGSGGRASGEANNA